MRIVPISASNAAFLSVMVVSMNAGRAGRNAGFCDGLFNSLGRRSGGCFSLTTWISDGQCLFTSTIRLFSVSGKSRPKSPLQQMPQ
jgi:hypothetical protein